MAEESGFNPWGLLESFGTTVVEAGGEKLRREWLGEPSVPETQPPVEQTVTTVPADASDRGAVQPTGNGAAAMATLENTLRTKWPLLVALVALVLLLFAVRGR